MEAAVGNRSVARNVSVLIWTLGNLRVRHTRREVAATRTGDKPPQQFTSCDTVNFVKIIVAAGMNSCD